jgi:predicted ATPase
MEIKRIKVANFKSFKELDLEIGRLNVLVGANASGKSNFTQIFKFVRDIASLGLDNAISLQGSEYLPNIITPSPKTLSVMFVFKPGFGFRAKKSLLVDITQSTYEFALRFGKNGGSFEIEKDKLTLKVDYARWSERNKKSHKKNKTIGSGSIVVFNDNGLLKTTIQKPSGVEITEQDLLSPFWREKLPPKTILIEVPYIPPVRWSFADIALYDFDPKLSKKAALVTGKSELEENGDNLSLVLKNITEDSEKKRKFSNLIKDLLPFVDDLRTDKFVDRSLIFKLSETYYKDGYFPASFISDGTVNISALLIALYFEKKDFIVIEEPERSVHPHLISRLMDMMKDASKNKQIIVTTHSPEVVKHTDIENLLLVRRDKDGFSTISRPGEKDEVKIFLKNELGLDEIFVQNLWGV